MFPPSSKRISKSKFQNRKSQTKESSFSDRVNLNLKSPILGKNFKIPDLYSDLMDITFDDTLPYVPIYRHLIIPDIEPVIRPKTPPVLTQLRAELKEADESM